RTKGPVSAVAFSPDAAIAMVKGFNVALGAVMVVGLLVLGLGMELLKLRIGGSAELQEAVGLSGDAWLQSLGVGCSILLFISYVFPMLRLRPYSEAAKAMAQPKPPKSGDIRFEVIEKFIGAGRIKFATILQAANHGGGFQELVNESLASRLATVLGLLAPATMSGVLSLLG
ncbi:MAG: hypothetical protein AAFN59_11975, partial [Pseudomonadota bacterium]